MNRILSKNSDKRLEPLSAQSCRGTASLFAMQQRARILANIRSFFKERQVLEVETPLLSQSGVTDPHLHSFTTDYQDAIGDLKQTLYLQTSPEFAMKRLLASDSGPIYQITRAFRNRGEQGRWHNPEFTLLEWYRPGFTLTDLMDETESLLQTILSCPPAHRVSYAEIFNKNLRLDPHQATLPQLHLAAQEHGIFLSPAEANFERDELLQRLLDRILTLSTDRLRPLFLHDFPVTQAALAQIRPGPPPVAERVEVYLNGLELANGFHELRDAIEQRARFEADLEYRAIQNLPQVPLDEQLLSALTHLPDCSGIALGIDRLIAIAIQAETLSEVIHFPL